MNFRILIMSVAMAATAGTVWAKLPAAKVDPAQAEAKAKSDAAQKQKDADDLNKAQDRAVGNYRKNKGIKGSSAEMSAKKK
ncbi:MAG TPA: hypothetical protein VE008_07600 [Burkholderiales bacterium]|nr:hypothetical protein [Burkholderiales bacterium]